MNIKLLSILLLCFSTIMIGCTTRPLTQIKANYDLDNLALNGVVFGSLTQSRGEAVSLLYFLNENNKWSVYTESREEGFFGYKDGDFHNVEGKLFVFEVPDGKYKISTWTIKRGIDVFISPRVKPFPIEFSVEKGKVTYIGNIHLNFRIGQNLFGMNMVFGGYPSIKDEFKRDYKTFNLMYSTLANIPYVKKIPFTGPWLKELESVIDIPISPVPILNQ